MEPPVHCKPAHSPNIETEARLVNRTQKVEFYAQDRWYVGKVNAHPRHHDGRVGILVRDDMHENWWVIVDADHPVTILG